MILWRGWGILGFLLILAIAGLFVAIGTAAAPNTPSTVWFGGGLILGGIAGGALGWYMNIARPSQKADEWSAQREAQLAEAVRSGQFQLAPGVPMPTSLEQAQQQADQLLASEEKHVRQRLRGRHTVWFIPMEWLGAVAAVIGIVLIVVGFIG